MEARTNNEFRKQLAEQEQRWREQQQDRHLHEVYGSQFDVLKWDKFVDSESGMIIYSDPESGNAKVFHLKEVEDGSTIIPPDERERRQAAKEKREQREYQVKDKKEKFVFINSSIDFSDVPPAMVTRLIYLSTYAAYIKQADKSKVFDKSLGTPLVRLGKHLQRKDLASVLGISERNAVNFVKCVCPRFICEDESGGLYLVKGFFARGKLKRKQFTRYQRLYNNGVRKLYEAVKGKYHAQLGYVFMMIPYINIEHNVLCWNPTETDIGKVQPMTPKDFCSLIAKSAKNLSRLMNLYKGITFDVDGKEEHFCKVVSDWNNQKNGIICVNPAVIYAGTDAHRLDIMKLFFNENPGT